MQTDINPYATPHAPPPEQASRPRLTAVLIGAAIGNGIAYAVLAVIGLGFLWLLRLQGVPIEELYVRMFASTPYLVLAHTAALICMLPGGYWSARLSPSKGTAAALWAAVLMAAFAALDLIAPYELPLPAWSRPVSLLSPFPAFWLGAVIWYRRDAARSQKPVSAESGA
jgi:hypothetical protein